MYPNNLDAFASYLVLDFLEREGISPHLRQSLVNEVIFLFTFSLPFYLFSSIRKAFSSH